MARRILSEFGPERTLGKHRLSGLVHKEPRDVHNYQHPVGPTSINDPQRPGIDHDPHGTNHEESGSQIRSGSRSQHRTAFGSSSSGRPGLEGARNCAAGSQGKH
jgi:hypothetical protein